MISAIGRKSGHRRAHRGAQDRLLGNRRVAHPQRPELLVKPYRRLEDAARLRDVLAEEDDAVVALHFLRDAACDGVAISQFRHAQPPSAYTSVVSNSTGAGGDALQAAVAASTLRLLSASIASIVSSATPKSLRRLPIDDDRIALQPFLQFAGRTVFRRDPRGNGPNGGRLGIR